MRLYVKFALMVALFAALASTTGRRMTGALAYEARVAFVFAFGSEADYAALLDDTQRVLAAETGNVELYLAGQRFRQLLADRLADAARRNVPLTDDDVVRIHAECARDAFEWHGPSRRHAAVTTPVTGGPLAQESDARLSRPHPIAQSHQ